jgi:hypothetical protein
VIDHADVIRIDADRVDPQQARLISIAEIMKSPVQRWPGNVLAPGKGTIVPGNRLMVPGNSFCLANLPRVPLCITIKARFPYFECAAGTS